MSLSYISQVLGEKIKVSFRGKITEKESVSHLIQKEKKNCILTPYM
jgi:hypothetical protein